MLTSHVPEQTPFGYPNQPWKNHTWLVHSQAEAKALIHKTDSPSDYSLNTLWCDLI